MFQVLVVISLLIIFSGVKLGTAHAYQPCSHYILMERSAKALSEGSIIKKALQTYPKIAAWGANGPDLGLIQLGELFGYSPWSCEYHYFKVGSFTATQLKKAIESEDLKKIALAAGWVTHICGDMECHGIFVNPECGVYLDKPEGRTLHIALERAAEPYLWVNMGKYSKRAYKKDGIAQYFCKYNEVPFEIMIETSKEIYGKAPGDREARRWVLAFHTGMKTGVGYKYTDYDEAVEFLSTNNRIERLEKSFYSSLQRTTYMLKEAERGNYDIFSDGWVLDVGRSDSPISNLTVEVKTASNSFSHLGTGTEDYVYFGMALKDGTVKEWALHNGKASWITVNDFQAGNKDKFYLYVDRFSSNITPYSVKKIWIRKEKHKLSLGHNWYPEHMTVYVNSIVGFDSDINQWLNDSNKIYEREVDFSSIPGIPDGPNLIGEYA